MLNDLAIDMESLESEYCSWEGQLELALILEPNNLELISYLREQARYYEQERN